MNNMKKQLTIIIPLFGRDYATRRILDQMSSDKVPFKIILADGSGQDKYSSLSIEKYTDLDVEYIDFGEDKTINDFMNKLHKATSMVETPFTVLIDNDDLISLDGMFSAIKFLSENKSYASFRGALLEIENSKDIKGSRKQNQFTAEKSITGDTVYDRVSTDLIGKDAAWQDVTRTSVIKKLYELLFRSGTQDLMLTFTINSSFTLIYGKNHRDFSFPLVYHICGDSLIFTRPDWLGYKGWLNYKYIDAEPMSEDSMEQISQSVLNELGFNDLDLDELKKESLESKYVGENPEGIW